MINLHCHKCDNTEFNKPDKNGFVECCFCHTRVRPHVIKRYRHSLEDIFKIMRELYKKDKEVEQC